MYCNEDLFLRTKVELLPVSSKTLTGIRVLSMGDLSHRIIVSNLVFKQGDVKCKQVVLQEDDCHVL